MSPSDPNPSIAKRRPLTLLLDTLLANQLFVDGDALSSADIAHFGWLWRRDFAGVSFEPVPIVRRCMADLEAGPACRRAIIRTIALAQG